MRRQSRQENSAAVKASAAKGSRAQALTRRERQRAGYYRDILDAALELFTAQGYHRVTMSQIARKAEFSVGMLYKFFKNKEDLYHSLLLEKFEEFAGIQILTLRRDTEVLVRIREYVDNAIRFFYENTAFIRIFLAESRGESFNLRSNLRKEAHAILDTLDEALAAVMREGIRKKVFRRRDPLHLTLALQGICQTFLFHFADCPERYPGGPPAEVILDFFARGALAEPESHTLERKRG